VVSLVLLVHVGLGFKS